MEILLISHFTTNTVILNSTGGIVQEFNSLDESLKAFVLNSQNTAVVTDSKKVEEFLLAAEIKSKIDLENPILKNWRINRFDLFAENIQNAPDSIAFGKSIRSIAMEETKKKIQATAGKRDELAAQIIQTIDDLQKSLNLTANRLSELYSLYFPELVDAIKNPLTLAKLVSTLDTRTAITASMLENYNLPQTKIKHIVDSKDNSLGGNLTEVELKPIKVYAESLQVIGDQIHTLEEWIDKEMVEIAPNLSAVAGPNVGARLISSVGSLRSLAMKSSSKIQTIGAERALYASLRGRGMPPKHGVIFQIPEIGNSPYWLRGKLARAYSGKITIAARLDEFGGEFLGLQYRTELRQLEAKLREQFPKAPPRKEVKHTKQQHPAKRRIKGRKRQ